MSADKYAQLDAAIVQAIREGKTTFTPLTAAVDKQADALAKPDRYGQLDGWRVIDRRLQAMRRRGVLQFSHKTGWGIA